MNCDDNSRLQLLRCSSEMVKAREVGGVDPDLQAIKQRKQIRESHSGILNGKDGLLCDRGQSKVCQK